MSPFSKPKGIKVSPSQRKICFYAEIYYVAQAGLRPVLLSPALPSADITGMCHHAKAERPFPGCYLRCYVNRTAHLATNLYCLHCNWTWQRFQFCVGMPLNHVGLHGLESQETVPLLFEPSRLDVHSYYILATWIHHLRTGWKGPSRHFALLPQKPFPSAAPPAGWCRELNWGPPYFSRFIHTTHDLHLRKSLFHMCTDLSFFLF